MLFIEGSKACLVNPQAEDTSVYAYGLNHPVLEGRYRLSALKYNRIQIEGYDSVSGTSIITDSFNWDEIGKVYDRLLRQEDGNIGTVSQAQARGDTYLRESGIEAADGLIRVPANCGHQLYDVIDITDSRAGLDARRRGCSG